MDCRFLSIALICLVACSQKSSSSEQKAESLPAGTTFETIEGPVPGTGTKDTGHWPNLLLDQQGTLTVAYCDANLGDAKVARKRGDNWVIETVESKGAVGKYMSAQLGPNGLELVYFDQSRKTLRYAAEGSQGWTFADIASDKDDIGISGRFMIAPNGERLFVYYNTRNELLLTKGETAPTRLTWSTQKLATAGGVYTIQIDLGVDKAGRVLLSYPNWMVSRATFYQGLLTNLRAAKLQDDLQFRIVDEEGVAGLKSAFVFLPATTYELLYMSSRGGVLYSAALKNNEFEKKVLTSNIANFAAKGLSDGRLAVALQVGREEGLGEGALQLLVRDKGALKTYMLDESRPVGGFLSVAEVKGATRPEIDIAYYDGVKKALRLARIP